MDDHYEDKLILHNSNVLEEKLDAFLNISEGKIPSLYSETNVTDFLNISSFEALLDLVRSGEVICLRFRPPNPYMVKLLASKWKYRFTLFLGYAPVIIFIGMLCLTFFVSAWWLFGIIFTLGPFKLQRSIYDSIILKAALSGEKAFCILYSLSQIQFADPSYENTWNTRSEKNNNLS